MRKNIGRIIYLIATDLLILIGLCPLIWVYFHDTNNFEFLFGIIVITIMLIVVTYALIQEFKKNN